MNDMAHVLTCPCCQGARRSPWFVTATDGCGVQMMDCAVCAGSGTVSVDHDERVAEGKKFREDRTSRRATFRQEATRLSCGVPDIADIEHGREPRTEAGRLALERRRREMRTKA